MGGKALINYLGKSRRAGAPPRSLDLPRHPHHARFAANRSLVESILESAKDDADLDRALRARGHSLRSAAREIPPVFGSI